MKAVSHIGRLIRLAQLRRHLKEQGHEPQARDFFLTSGLDQKSTKQDVLVAYYQHIKPESPLQWLHPNLLFLSIGLLAGSLAMAGSLSYSGHQPVNLVFWLLLFVGLQWLLMIFGLVFLKTSDGESSFWSGWIVKLPLGRWIVDLPFQLIRPLMFYFNQLMASGFLVGGLLVFLIMLVAQDLAFGWATTLQVKSSALAGVVQTLALPWQSLWTAAFPTLELIEATRFYRLQEVEPGSAEWFGHWWPFLLCCLMFYSVLPRIGLLWLGRKVLSQGMESVCTTDYHLASLYQQLVQPQLNLDSDQHSLDTKGQPIASQPDAEISEKTAIKNCPNGFAFLAELEAAPVFWHLEPDRQTALEAQLALSSPAQVFGQQSYQHDLNLAEQLASQNLVWLVPGWEPPTGELTDLLRVNSHHQYLLLVALEPGDDSLEWGSWQHFIEQLKRQHPNVSVQLIERAL